MAKRTAPKSAPRPTKRAQSMKATYQEHQEAYALREALRIPDYDDRLNAVLALPAFVAQERLSEAKDRINDAFAEHENAKDHLRALLASEAFPSGHAPRAALECAIEAIEAASEALNILTVPNTNK